MEVTGCVSGNSEERVFVADHALPKARFGTIYLVLLAIEWHRGYVHTRDLVLLLKFAPKHNALA